LPDPNSGASCVAKTHPVGTRLADRLPKQNFGADSSRLSAAAYSPIIPTVVRDWALPGFGFPVTDVMVGYVGARLEKEGLRDNNMNFVA